MAAPGHTHLLAHSMGNVVAAEALRLWNASGHVEELVHNYMATQGAISAGAYGSSDAGAQTGWGTLGFGETSTDFYRHWPSGHGSDAATDYYMKGADSAATNWINFFNPVDAATSGEKRILHSYLGVNAGSRGAWPLNNWLRLSTGSYADASRSTVWDFDYRVASNGWIQRGRWEWNGILATYEFVSEVALTPGMLDRGADGDQPLPGPSAYEILAFAARSQAMPIGTMAMDEENSPFETNVDLRLLGLPEEYEDEWPGHSFQYNFDAATTDAFWRKVVTLIGQVGA